MPKRQSIAIDQAGLGALLKHGGINVPLYQRAYSWTEQNVIEYLSDTFSAMKDASDTYFMGTVVLSDSGGRSVEVTDGQQRLATTAITISAIRDILIDMGDVETAESLQSEYLSKTSMRDRLEHPNISLNKIDDPVFLAHVIGKEPWPAHGNLRESQARIKSAYELARRWVGELANARLAQERRDFILDYVEYLTDHAMVLAVRVDDSMNAFTLFETLNDRGLRAAQVDILKNYLFGRAADSFSQVERSWSEMVDLVVSTGAEDDILQFIKASWISQDGPTREKDLSSHIKAKIRSKRQAVEFCKRLRKEADIYVAIRAHDSDYWDQYPPSTRDSLYAINEELQLGQVLPLTLAVAATFSPEECAKAFRYLVSCAVRLLIVGGGGAGVAERSYGLAAQKVLSKKIGSARELRDELRLLVPADSQFRDAFSSARVSQARLARYYLRAIENYLRAKGESELEVIRATEKVNLEHVLPKAVTAGWGVKTDEWESLVNRLGNLALFNSKRNVKIGNQSFQVKKAAFQKSDLITTASIGNFVDWDRDAVVSHQTWLASHAAEVWPTTF